MQGVGQRRDVQPQPVLCWYDRASATEQSCGSPSCGRAKRRSIQFVEHLTGDGPTIFAHVCQLGLEGIVSVDSFYRSGPSKMWVKSKNPLSEAVRRETEEDWS